MFAARCVWSGKADALVVFDGSETMRTRAPRSTLTRKWRKSATGVDRLVNETAPTGCLGSGGGATAAARGGGGRGRAQGEFGGVWHRCARCADGAERPAGRGVGGGGRRARWRRRWRAWSRLATRRRVASPRTARRARGLALLMSLLPKGRTARTPPRHRRRRRRRHAAAPRRCRLGGPRWPPSFSAARRRCDRGVRLWARRRASSPTRRMLGNDVGGRTAASSTTYRAPVICRSRRPARRTGASPCPRRPCDV